MGWLEVLATLKRLLPLLTRLTPALEGFLASRAGSRAGNDALLQQATGAIRQDLVVAGERHDSLANLLTAQGLQLTELTEGVRQLRSTDHRTNARLLEMEAAVGGLTGILRALHKLIVVLIVLAAAILAVVLFLLVRWLA